MPLAALQALADSVLSRLGQDAFLQGTPCRIAIEHGTEIGGYQGDVVMRKSVATLSNQMMPAAGMTVEHPDGDYKLDALIMNNGYNSRYTLVPQV